MKKNGFIALMATLLFGNTVSCQESPAIQTILKKVSPQAIEGTMRFLSDDLLEGRLPGTRGFALGSAYMESQFVSLGLQPGMGDTSFVQNVPLQKGWVEPDGTGLILQDADGKKTSLSLGKEFLMQPYFPAAKSQVTASLVFAGFGVSAPEFNYDDYADLDVKGKIVVFLIGAPKSFPSSERAYFSTTDVKYKEAIQRGAVGVIIVPSSLIPPAAWEGYVRRSKTGVYKWAENDGRVASGYAPLKAAALLHPQYLEALFSHAPVTAQQIFAMAAEGKSKSFPLDMKADMQVSTITRSVESSNLVGVIKGSDPVLKNEYVVYSAHLDHLGIGTPVNQDSIYNGAHDDASGNAILLEIARAYRSLPTRPKRSIVFAVVTGEEMGLLGSDYFINHLPFPEGKVVANLAIDMPFFFHPVLDIVPYGADHSSLGMQTQRAAKVLGLKISPDPFPEQVIFIRSDHYSFIQKGIPALFIKSGFMTVPSDTVNRAKSDVGWRSTIYHTPKDDMNQPFDFTAATTHVIINFLIGYYVSNETAKPVWNTGDFFGKKFGK